MNATAAATTHVPRTRLMRWSPRARCFDLDGDLEATATWRPLLGIRPSRPLGLKDRLGLGALDQADHMAVRIAEAGNPWAWGWPSAPGSYCGSGSSCPGASLRPAGARSARPTWATLRRPAELRRSQPASWASPLQCRLRSHRPATSAPTARTPGPAITPPCPAAVPASGRSSKQRSPEHLPGCCDWRWGNFGQSCSLSPLSPGRAGQGHTRSRRSHSGDCSLATV
jgi:hypothetical protein